MVASSRGLSSRLLQRAAEAEGRVRDLEETLNEIADLIAPHLSTRFVDGDPLADELETLLGRVGIKFNDTNEGTKRVK